MANETTNTTLNDLISPMVAEALFVANERSIMRGLVRNYNMPSNNGKVIQVPIYPTVSAAAVAEANDLSNTNINLNFAIDQSFNDDILEINNDLTPTTWKNKEI